MMLQIVKILLMLLSVVGVTELGFQTTHGKSFIDVAQNALHKTMCYFERSCQTLVSEEEVSHQKLWGYQDEHLDGGRRERFNDAMKKKMMDHKTCHMQCGMDRGCHQQCPKPWKSFQEKCERAQAITDCHKSCHENHGSFECHYKCPLPECPKMAQKMQDAMQCHSKCKKGEYGCHKACPKPMKKMMGMCQELNEVVSCHQVCEPGDFKCHHECPHMQGIWKFHGQRIGEHEQEHHHMQHDEIVACHKRCAGEHSCLASCPSLRDQMPNEIKQDAGTAAALNIPLVSFAPDAAPSLTHKWSALNDPVMGGQSYSNVSVSNGILKFTGKCAIVPFLGAPGFITAATGRGFGPGHVDPETFVDVSSCKGLTIIAKDYSNGYSGYRISFGNGHVPGTHHAYGFKADLHPTVGSFGAVSIPFTNFTDFWDDATGKPIHSCKENREYCPDKRTLTNMQTMSIWAEGVEGHVHLEVKSIAGYSCATTMKQELSNLMKDAINILVV